MIYVSIELFVITEVSTAVNIKNLEVLYLFFFFIRHKGHIITSVMSSGELQSPGINQNQTAARIPSEKCHKLAL